MHSQLAKQTLESKLLEIGNPAGWRDSIAVRTSADPTDTTQQGNPLNLDKNVVVFFSLG
jgi:hypothetical protein